MAKYYYNKYTATIQNVVYSDPTSFIPVGSISATLNQYPGASFYSFDSTNGFVGTGSKNFPSSVGEWMFSGGGYDEYLWEAESYTAPNYAITLYRATCTQTTTYSQGSLAASNVIAEDGTYPVDGQYGDGYWYVRQGLAPLFFFMNF